MPSIDRLKDAKADEVEIRNGTNSRRQIFEGKGKDYDKVKRELKSENHMSLIPCRT